MNEQMTFFSEKPKTLVKYGKVIIMNEQNYYENENKDSQSKD